MAVYEALRQFEAEELFDVNKFSLVLFSFWVASLEDTLKFEDCGG